MARKMAKSVVNPDHWPEMSDEFNKVVDSDNYAKCLYMSMYQLAKTAWDWYERAEENERIARWVPLGGGGDCFLVHPGEESAANCDGMYGSLMLYLKMNGHDDLWLEMRDMKELFFWFDSKEMAPI